MKKFNSSIFILLILLLFFTSILFSVQSGSSIIYPETFKYKAGDQPEWALAGFDDTAWETAKYKTVPDVLYKTIGWARYIISVKSDFLNKPLALSIRFEGAAELYLDGKLIQSFGKIGLSKIEEIPVIETYLNSYPILFKSKSLNSDLKGLQNKYSKLVLAIRYSSFFLNTSQWSGYKLDLGFSIGKIRKMTFAIKNAVRGYTITQILLTSVFFTLALLHILLFLFYPKEKMNLYFSLFAFVSSTAVFFIFQAIDLSNPIHLINMTKLFSISLVFLTIFGLRFVYSLLRPYPPKLYYFFYIPLGSLLLIWNFFRPFETINYITFFTFAITLELPRIILINLKDNYKGEEFNKGSWIIGIGSIPILLTGIYQILFMLNLVPKFLSDVHAKPFYAMIALMISVSVFLAYQFADTRKNLEAKLIEVEKLSEKRLKEERIRLQLEAENTRKTRELEEARKLQLSMLPKIIPQLPNLEIAVYMQTASEVGGDYYDFFLEENEKNETILTAVIGDATGHGLQAGTMVAATKSLFNAYASEKEPIKFLQKTSSGLKKMGFQKMFMAMTIAKFTNNHLQISSAGMPYTLIKQTMSNSVEEVVLKGMPLGNIKEFPYKEAQYSLEKGDIILFMSDGLPEAFNPKKEMFGSGKIKNIFQKISNQSPEEIISHLIETGKKWADGIEFQDDVTIMVIKIK